VDDMFQKLIHSFKVEIKAREAALWFALSFAGVLAAYLFIMKRSMDTSLLAETFGFALVFVLMMIGTKSYGHFVDGYYQSYIDRQGKKNANKKTKSSKKKK
jgi:hypothetical protein